VVVNLYAFEKVAAQRDAHLAELIENIDIGGPTLIRAAAKNYQDVAVVVNPVRYDEILALLKQSDCSLSVDFKFSLMREAFRHTALYDSAIANYFESKYGEKDFARRDSVAFGYSKDIPLRYGENPHQHAALFGSFTQYCNCFHGKELSYNNILDATAAIRLVAEFDEPTVAIIKHTNPCGVASHKDIIQAYRDAFATDTAAPFGGIVAVNRKIEADFAQVLNEIFLEILIAPDFSEDALTILKKKKDRRLLSVRLDAIRRLRDPDVRSVIGGVLVQDSDSVLLDANALKPVTERKPGVEEMKSLLFAWTVAKHVKSNAIVFANSQRTLGIGAGQMSRVDSVRLAIWKAHEMKLDLRNSVVASDAFFPFADNIEALSAAGATAVIQPGGSMRDGEVIEAANQKNVAMVFTGIRHFRH
ncbi:MAG TPA: bifunctional phosphoribosylaminoimidazolecarboxamide formyltransferase/IMP cyclohydrolase, partial [Candidatus Kapabacteria bacterium]|nr:bifunctional phosphoribosylaminoimidazolecarboxamide formyltransferase/IMP cyclohydrolase [Candidatus Kapabacteria bacterium]